MPGSGIPAPMGEATADQRRARGSRLESQRWEEDRRRYAGGDDVPSRRTVTITGHGAEAYTSRNGTRPSAAQRHQQVRRHERAGFRPDRVAMWAVLLCVVMILAAVTSSHAAVLATHHALAGLR